MYKLQTNRGRKALPVEHIKERQRPITDRREWKKLRGADRGMRRGLQKRSDKGWRVDEAERYMKAVADGKRLCRRPGESGVKPVEEEGGLTNTRPGSALAGQAFYSRCLR